MKLDSKKYAHEILDDIEDKRIEISNKEKNIKFLKKYNLSTDERKRIIKVLDENNFTEKRVNKDKKIKTDYLYIFSPMYQLTDNYGITNMVKLYIKICKIDKIIYAESFHEDGDY